ncbi:MAG: hypothetical protein JKY54_06800 [Flavobacteriales bacterium]|nr:hypothetical protein [Flavobacteriales bacterium]
MTQCCENQTLIHREYVVCTNCGSVVDDEIIDDYDSHTRTSAKYYESKDKRKTYFSQIISTKFLRRLPKSSDTDKIEIAKDLSIDECVKLGYDISVYNGAHGDYIMPYTLTKKVEELSKRLSAHAKDNNHKIISARYFFRMFLKEHSIEQYKFITELKCEKKLKRYAEIYKQIS